MQRFIEDQKVRQAQGYRDSYLASTQDGDVDYIIASHKRVKEVTEVLLLPEKLEMQQHPNYNHKYKQEQNVKYDLINSVYKNLLIILKL